MSPHDAFNACFELGGGILMVLNIRRVLRDKVVRGVTWSVVTFFAAWGGWNLLYYFHLGQWLSWAAGALLFVTNSIYAAMLIYYTMKEKDRDTPIAK